MTRDRIALTIYLSNLNNPQVAFGVKQSRPSTLDAAVSATLELESYLTPKPNTLSVMAVEEEQKPKDSVVGGVDYNMEKLCGLLKELIDATTGKIGKPAGKESSESLNIRCAT